MSTIGASAIDLSASLARVQSARKLAEAQARRVEAASPGADPHAIDMLFLLQESVLVFTETHAMLEKLAARQAARQTSPVPPYTLEPRRTEPGPSSGRRAAMAALTLAAAVIGSAWTLEIIDPAPMDAFATVVSALKGKP